MTSNTPPVAPRGRFVRLGAVDTEPNPTRPDRVSCRLTPKGLTFFPVVVVMIS
ncbi:hypothetical protein [Gordonia alkanivorans]|uniref:hypothetical protein n=1 Tax=Gordonia alkanivorans TaxID=84096 RepID=UPI0004B31464|nr:hypothetical protein [Gordonia alkanivorans]